MAQTNYTPISLYYSATASNVPTAANLVPGELAINTADGKLYYEDSSGVVQVLATKSTGSIGGSNTQVQFNNSGSLGGSSSFTWDGTTVTATKFAGALNGTVGATTASTGAFTTLSTSSTTTLSGLTASTALALDASKNVVSVTNTGTGNNVLSASPTLTGTIAGASLSLSSLTTGRVVTTSNSGLLTDSANLAWDTNTLSIVSPSNTPLNLSSSSTSNTLIQLTNANAAKDLISRFRQNGGGGNWWDLTMEGSTNGFTFDYNDGEKVRITSAGNVGIGTSSPNRLLSLYATQPVFQITNVASGNTQGTIQYQESGATNFILDNQGSGSGGSIIFQQAGSERMRIDSSGNLLVGTTSSYSGERVTIDFTGTTQRGMIVRNTTSTASDAVAFVVNSTFVGWIGATTTGVTYNTISDYRLKNITGAVTGAKDFIMALQPKQGTWKSDGSKFVGFVAHEFAEVSPTSVSRSKDELDENGNPVYQGIQASSSEVMANLISLVQEQQALIESLTTRLTALESK